MTKLLPAAYRLKIRYRFLILLPALIALFAAVSIPAAAQLKAGFYANTTEACSSALVQFTNTSTGSPTSSEWLFEGNPQPIYETNPTVSFDTPGTYTVTLIVKDRDNNTDTSVRKAYITVHQMPKVAFTATPTSGCSPLRVHFTDHSTAGTDQITGWTWDFGDGTNFGTARNPDHVYENEGPHGVSLIVTTDKGCTSNSTGKTTIQVQQGLDASFTADRRVTCGSSMSVNFHASSPSSGPVTYHWFFGDKEDDWGTSVFHKYNAPGDYTVMLIATSPSSCPDTVVYENYIQVASFHASFTVPKTWCQGVPLELTNTTDPELQSAIWTFGDNTKANTINATHTYNKPGPYTITLTNDFGGCTYNASETIQVVAPPTTDFTATSEKPVCGQPTPVTFKNISSGDAVSYLWDYGDGNTSTSKEQVHAYSVADNYLITLTATNAAGCATSRTHTTEVKVLDPAITIDASPRQGCTPLGVHFYAQVANLGKDTQYTWDFGGKEAGGSGNNPTHKYSTAGDYDVKLKVVTDGCADSVIRKDFIQVTDPTKIDVSVADTTVCFGSAVSIANNSANPNAGWQWQFPDDNYSNDYGYSPTHQFTHLGKQDAIITVDNNGCIVQLIKPGFLTVEPPMAAFELTQSCADPYAVTFQDESLGATDWHWSFGDNSTLDTENPPLHRYKATGTYTATLHTENGECVSDTTVTFQVIDVHPVLKVSDTVVCHGSSVTFSLQDVDDITSIRHYSWILGNEDTYGTTNPSLSYTYNRAGVYQARLIVTDLNGCTDTSAPVSITVRGPVAEFTLSSPSSCAGKDVTFKDHSTVSGAAITQWEWDFGNGSMHTVAVDTVTHTYTQDGLYDVSMTVTDQNGCTDRTVHYGAVSVFSSKADFSTPDNPTCPGSPVDWVNKSQGNQLTYEWNFGDHTTSDEANPEKSYENEGTYSVSLKVISNIGCEDSVTKQDYIRVAEPRADWEYSDNGVTCPPFIISVKNLSENYSRIVWDFGDGSGSDNTQGVSHVYTMGGTYRLRMLVYGYGNGCVDSVVREIAVTGPSGTATVTDSIGCSPHAVRFSATSLNAATYQWNFADGNVSEPSLSGGSTHSYQHGGVYQPKLILADKTGCQVYIPTPQRVRIDEIAISPSVTLPQVCDSSIVQFKLQGSIFSQDTLGIPPVYAWDFGDPASAVNQSSAAEPRHSYSASNDYTAHLEVTTIYGCQVRIPVAVKVPKPFVMKVVPSRDTTICKGSQATLHATGAYRYLWSPAEGLSDVNSDSPSAAPASTTTYRVIGYARGNCQIDTAYTTVGVQELPHAAISTPDTLVCPGAPINWLNASTGVDLGYKWDFGDGSGSKQQVPAKDYITSGLYTVSLLVTSKVGCQDSVVKENYIRVGEPHALWNYADSNAACLPMVVSIKNLSENYRRIHWDFGDGTSSEDTSSVRHSYGVPGSYRLRMLVYGFSKDCMDSIVKIVEVKGPYGFPKIADSIGCSPFPAQFSAVATNTVSYQWDFGDGTSSDASPTDAATHTYPHGGIFQPVVELTDPRGCRLAIPTPHRVQVDEIHVTPSASFPEVCDSSIRGFQVEGTIFTKDSLDLPVTYQWDFGEPAYAGNSATGETPRHDYHAAGQYATQLTVETSYGCTATAPLAVSVPEPYVLRVTGSSDTTICKGSPVVLNASGAVRYVWSPSEGLSTLEGPSTVAIPASTITYQVVGYSAGDCQSDTARTQIIVKNQPVITLPADTTVGTGSTFMLPVSYSPDAITWNWTPSQYLDCANCATPVTTPHSPIAYRVVTSNQWGCSDTASVNIHLICKEGKVFIPNTFTPNGDGMNDIFYPRGKGVSQVLEFLIYNRWGQLMYSRSYFQLNDKSAGWDGTFKGQKLAPGVFVYQTLMRCESGNIFKLNGNVTLLR